MVLTPVLLLVLLSEAPGLFGLVVREVRFSPTTLARDEVGRLISDDAVGRPMTARTCKWVEQRVGAHWAVSAVRVRRVWPHALEVQVAERSFVGRTEGSPTLVIERGGQAFLADHPPHTLPLLIGWDDSPAWGEALEALVCLRQSDLGEGSTVHGPPRDGFVEVDCPRFGATLLLPCPADAGLASRLSFVPTVLADAHAKGERVHTVDVRWTNQIVVRKAP